MKYLLTLLTISRAVSNKEIFASETGCVSHDVGILKTRLSKIKFDSVRNLCHGKNLCMSHEGFRSRLVSGLKKGKFELLLAACLSFLLYYQ